MEESYIFDCDGVIVDSERFSLFSWIEILSDYNIKTNEEEISQFTGKTTLEVINYFENKMNITLPNNFGQLKEERYMQLSKGKLTAFENFIEFIQLLKNKNIKYSIASSGDIDKIIYSLKEANIYDYFDVICSASEVKKGKPHPDLFLFAANKMSADPNKCIVIEDSIYGIQGAKSAKMKAYGFTSSYSKNHLINAGADLVFDNYNFLIDLYKK